MIQTDLARVMARRGIGVRELARRTGYGTGAIMLLRKGTGRHGAPVRRVDVDLLDAVCSVLECKVEDILKRETAPSAAN